LNRKPPKRELDKSALQFKPLPENKNNKNRERKTLSMDERPQTWQEAGIRVDPSRTGQVTMRCPQCSEGRKSENKSKKCLSVNVAKGAWYCHNCPFRGFLASYKAEHHGEKKYTRPRYSLDDTPNEVMEKWFLERGIPPRVVRYNKIKFTTASMPQTGKAECCIAFPYFVGGEVVNVKYRTIKGKVGKIETRKDKLFRMESGAELVMWGLDEIDTNEPVTIVEGELDRLALLAAGVENVLSIPNGAPPVGAKMNLAYLEHAEPWLKACKEIKLAGDMDAPGKNLTAELIRRLDPLKCWTVTWPDGCKDGNDTLMKYGADKVRECVECADRVPIEGAYEISEIYDESLASYDRGRIPGVDPGWPRLAELYRPRPGDLTIITGVPSCGKSSLAMALLINLAHMHGWKSLIFAPENLPLDEYAGSLAEIYLGKPYDANKPGRMTKAEFSEALRWMNEYFVLLNPPDKKCTFDALLEYGRQFVYRRGINAMLIDPFNEVPQTDDQNEHKYIEQSLSKCRRFCRVNGVHGFIVAHPTKVKPNAADGSVPVIKPYDISGSSSWYNKADNILSLYRKKEKPDDPVKVHVQKIRFRWAGKLGEMGLYYDTRTGRWSESAHSWNLPPGIVYQDYSEGDYREV
jgi:twinkle protein